VKLSARSEYGLLALIDLATASARAGSNARAARIAPSRRVLEQLLADLRRAGLVTACGERAGVRARRDPRTISALDIVQALEDR